MSHCRMLTNHRPCPLATRADPTITFGAAAAAGSAEEREPAASSQTQSPSSVATSCRVESLASSLPTSDWNDHLATPACASSVSALRPSHTGVCDSKAGLSSAVPVFAHCPGRGGTRTVLSGKTNSCEVDHYLDFEEWRTTYIYPRTTAACFSGHPDGLPAWKHDMSSVLDAGPCTRSSQPAFGNKVAFSSERHPATGSALARRGRPASWPPSPTLVTVMILRLPSSANAGLAPSKTSLALALGVASGGAVGANCRTSNRSSSKGP